MSQAVIDWHPEVWQRLLAQQDQLPHALLLAGPRGIGKRRLAESWGQRLLCDAAVGAMAACGQCPACHWFVQGNHPDWQVVEPRLEDKKSGDKSTDQEARKPYIMIDQVRELQQFVRLTAQRGGHKVVLLDPADAINPAAANALLKLLEEPPPGVLFLLITHVLGRVLPTIRSRCRIERLSRPSRDQATDWLSQQGISDGRLVLDWAGGAPLLAQQAWQDGHRDLVLDVVRTLRACDRLNVLEVAERWHKQDLPWLFDAWQKWCYDVAQLSAGGTIRYYQQHAADLEPAARALDPRHWYPHWQALLEARKHVAHPLNQRLLLEQLLLGFRRMFGRTGGK